VTPGVAACAVVTATAMAPGTGGDAPATSEEANSSRCSPSMAPASDASVYSTALVSSLAAKQQDI
jgi:hypothetical protein